MSRLPGVLGEIAGITSEVVALAIAARVGGARVYIPARAESGHWLVEAVGAEAAARICAHFAVDGRGQRIDIPFATGGAYHQLKRQIAIRVHELDEAGYSSREIARRVGISQRRVHSHRAVHRGRKNTRQGSLF